MLETLLLDTGYTPLGRISWQKAITLWWLGKIQILEEYEDKTVRSVTVEIKVPSVVRWLRGNFHNKKARWAQIRFTRENVYIRDNGKCQYCGKALKRLQITYDHVVPRTLGGKTNWLNIALCCSPCNERKGGRTPEQAKMKLLKKPEIPNATSDKFRITFVWDSSMPANWKNWLRDQKASMVYWHGELETEE